jgi:hypothetical protein
MNKFNKIVTENEKMKQGIPYIKKNWSLNIEIIYFNRRDFLKLVIIRHRNVKKYKYFDYYYLLLFEIY